MKAKNLREALNILDPERPLNTEKELDNYFVERAMCPLEDLIPSLRETTGHQKVLFTGHRGSGKSTELAQLERLLGNEFFVVRYSVKNILNLFDLTYVDVVVSLGLQLFKEATAQKVRVKEEVLSHILDFTKEISKETEIAAKAQAGVGAELNFLAGKLSAKLGTEDATRETVRETVQHRLSDLLEAVDMLSREVEKKKRRRMLFIVEDLDKADLATAKHLFYGHATSLLAPLVCVIYTFPTALRHDNDYMQIQSNFPNPYPLPNLRTCLRDGTPDQEGLVQVREILTKRVEEALFTSEALNTLVELSGGIPRELIALGRQACLEAMKSDKSVINEEAAGKAALRRRIDYQVLLSKAQINLLEEVNETKKVDNDEAHRSLLHNLSVLEYRNDIGAWYDVHPIVKPLLAEEA